MTYFGDLVESIREGQFVDGFGDPRRCVVETPGVFHQHPRYLDYWYEPRRNALVGLHLGIDLISHAGDFFIVEINLDAAIRPTRRALYDIPLDPVVLGIAQSSLESGFRRVVFYHRRWSSQYRDEIRRAGDVVGIETLAAASPHHDRDSVPLPGLPMPLEQDTAYVSFHGRHTPLDYYVHNKKVSTEWISDLLTDKNGAISYERLRVPLSSGEAFIPISNPGPEYPNVVVKLSGSDRGQGILMGKFNSPEHIRRELGLDSVHKIPRQFRSSPLRRLSNVVFDAGEPIFQEFIPPSLDESGRPFIYRLHILVTPRFDRFLSVHKVVAKNAVSTAPLPLGIVTNAATFIVNFSQGAEYKLVSDEELAEFESLAAKLGMLIRSGIVRKFYIGPRESPQL